MQKITIHKWLTLAPIVLLISCTADSITEPPKTIVVSPKMTVSPTMINYGDVELKDPVEHSFLIQNTSDTLALNVYISDCSHPFYFRDTNRYFTVPKADSLRVYVRYNPTTLGTHQDSIVLVSDASPDSIQKVFLKGNGVPRTLRLDQYKRFTVSIDGVKVTLHSYQTDQSGPIKDTTYDGSISSGFYGNGGSYTTSMPQNNTFNYSYNDYKSRTEGMWFIHDSHSAMLTINKQSDSLYTIQVSFGESHGNDIMLASGVGSSGNSTSYVLRLRHGHIRVPSSDQLSLSWQGNELDLQLDSIYHRKSDYYKHSAYASSGTNLTAERKLAQSPSSRVSITLFKR